MKPKSLRFRQVHLDFHTSPDLAGIGEKFNKKEWVETLRRGAVDSITIFSKCHHGWSYHPTQVGKTHRPPQVRPAARAVRGLQRAGVQCPIYISAGVDNLASHEHPSGAKSASMEPTPAGPSGSSTPVFT